MSLDDLVLAFQRALDRLVRRARRGAAPPRIHRRLLVVQIDGLSHPAIQYGLAAGRLPFLKAMLERHGHRLEPMSVGLPTSTPAFQMAAMYGMRPNIPGFHYYDRERRGDIHFPRAGHAAWVEERQAAGRLGIVHGGSTYGCVFTGGADNNFFSFATLTRPSGRGLLSALSPFVVLGWVAVKSTVYTVVELARAVLRFIANPTEARRGWRWTMIKIGMSVWVRGFFRLAVSRDLYEGDAGGLRELSRLRRGGARVRPQEPTSAARAAVRRSRDPPALARAPSRARASVRHLCSRRPRPG